MATEEGKEKEKRKKHSQISQNLQKSHKKFLKTNNLQRFFLQSLLIKLLLNQIKTIIK